MKKLNVVCLVIDCWKGMSLGAEHYMGSLNGDVDGHYKSIDLKAPITARHARLLNKKFRIEPGHELWHKGDIEDRFLTRDEVIQIAIKEYKTHFPDADVLITGSYASVEPKLILDGPKKIMEQGNTIYEEYRKIPWVKKYGFFYRDPKDEDKVNRLTLQYRKLGIL